MSQHAAPTNVCAGRECKSLEICVINVAAETFSMFVRLRHCVPLSCCNNSEMTEVKHKNSKN